MSVFNIPSEPPSPLARMLTGMGTGLQEGVKQFHQKKQGKSLGQVLGLEGDDLEAFSTLGPEQQKIASSLIQEREKRREIAEKERASKEIITPERKELLQDVLKRQAEIVKSGRTGYPGLGAAHKILSPKAREARAELDTLSSSIEATLMPLVSKGTLAKDRFKYIMSLLPKSTDTDATIKGKMKGLSREFGLQSPWETEKASQEEKRNLGDIFK